MDQKDEKELFDLYTQTKKESCGETQNKPNINNNPILYQITASFLEDRILAIKGTMWGFIKVIIFQTYIIIFKYNILK